jgi:hypothetical protein
VQPEQGYAEAEGNFGLQIGNTVLIKKMKWVEASSSIILAILSVYDRDLFFSIQINPSQFTILYL